MDSIEERQLEAMTWAMNRIDRVFREASTARVSAEPEQPEVARDNQQEA